MNKIEMHAVSYIGWLGEGRPVDHDQFRLFFQTSEDTTIALVKEMFLKPPVETTEDIQELVNIVMKVIQPFEGDRVKNDLHRRLSDIIKEGAERLRCELTGDEPSFPVEVQIFPTPVQQVRKEPDADGLTIVTRYIKGIVGGYGVYTDEDNRRRRERLRNGETMYRTVSEILDNCPIESEEDVDQLSICLDVFVNPHRDSFRPWWLKSRELIDERLPERRRKFHPDEANEEPVEKPAEKPVEAPRIVQNSPKVQMPTNASPMRSDVLTNRVNVQIAMRAVESSRQKREEAERQTHPADITERQYTIINVMRQNPTITIDRLVEATKIPRSTLVREVAILTKQGYVRRDGNSRSGTWIVNLIDRKPSNIKPTSVSNNSVKEDEYIPIDEIE